MKKVISLFALGGGAWLIWRYLNSIESDFYNDGGGFMAVSDVLSEVNAMVNDLPNKDRMFSTFYMQVLMKSENGIKKGWDAKKGLWFPHDDGLGIMTIGYGHKIKPLENFENGISDAEAVGLMLQDMEHHANPVRNNVKIELTQPQFDAFVDFCYHTGKGNFLSSAKSAARAWGLNPLKAINEKGAAAGLAEMDAYYKKFVSQPSKSHLKKGILNRSAAQQAMAAGDYGKALLI